MTPKEALLERLGATGLRLDEVARFEWADDEVGYGLSKGDMAAATLAGLSFLPLGVPQDAIGGRLLQARQSPRIVKYVPADATIGNVTAREPAQDTAVLEVLPAHAVIDFMKTDAVAIELNDGRTVVIGADGSIGELRLPIERLADVPPFPAESMLEDQDQWTRDFIAFQLEVHDSWHNAVAAGAYLRFATLPKRAPLPTFASESPAHRWVSGLTEAQRAAVLARLDARLDVLWMHLEALDVTVASHDQDWLDDLRRLCLERDDLESVRLLMNWPTTNTRMEERIYGLDALAEDAMLAIPRAVRLDDEQLYRAAVDTPLSWWTIPVRFDDANGPV